MDITGEIINIVEKQAGDKNFVEVRIKEVDVEYPNELVFTFWKDFKYAVWTIIDAGLNFRVSEYNDREFTNISARKVNTSKDHIQPTGKTTVTKKTETTKKETIEPTDVDDIFSDD